MRKFSLLIAFTLLSFYSTYAQRAKYVFYFIGDGMGVNQVLGTELYRGELEGKIGIVPPVVSPVSAGYRSHYLFCHQRSDRLCCCRNGTCHRKQDQKRGYRRIERLGDTVNSVAVWAKESGKRVGIATSVSVDHATPAAFYAHEAGRGSYYEIGKDRIQRDLTFMPVLISLTRTTAERLALKTCTAWRNGTVTPSHAVIKSI